MKYMKKCFTINPMRTREEFISYMKLLDDKLYQATEIFYPYNQSNAQIEQYTSSVNEIKKLYPMLKWFCIYHIVFIMAFA